MFNEMVESDDPPTVTALAEIGTLHIERPRECFAATHTVGALRTFVGFCDRYDAHFTAEGIQPWEREEARELVNKAEQWLHRLMEHLD